MQPISKQHHLFKTSQEVICSHAVRCVNMSNLYLFLSGRNKNTTAYFFVFLFTLCTVYWMEQSSVASVEQVDNGESLNRVF